MLDDATLDLIAGRRSASPQSLKTATGERILLETLRNGISSRRAAHRAVTVTF